MQNKKLITLVLPTFNEEENVEPIYLKLKEVLHPFLNKYEFHFIFIDNASEDSTLIKLKKLAWKEENLKIIVTRMQGWQLDTFKESYEHKKNKGISLFKKNFLESKN